MLMKIKIGKIEKGAAVGVLLKPEDVHRRLPQNVPFHIKAFITKALNGNKKQKRYEVLMIGSDRTFTIGRDQIKPLPFSDSLSQMSLRNLWEAYIEMNLWQYLKYAWQKLNQRLRIIKILYL